MRFSCCEGPPGLDLGTTAVTITCFHPVGVLRFPPLAGLNAVLARSAFKQTLLPPRNRPLPRRPVRQRPLTRHVDMPPLDATGSLSRFPVGLSAANKANR
jgi:hypothetical protein